MEKIIENMFIADTFKERLFGYMFRKKPHHKAIMIKPCNSIHTFFMKFNIDVLFVNEAMVVVKKIENLEKNRVVIPVKEAKFVIEAKAFDFEDISEGCRVTLNNY